MKHHSTCGRLPLCMSHTPLLSGTRKGRAASNESGSWARAKGLWKALNGIASVGVKYSRWSSRISILLPKFKEDSSRIISRNLLDGDPFHFSRRYLVLMTAGETLTVQSLWSSTAIVGNGHLGNGNAKNRDAGPVHKWPWPISYKVWRPVKWSDS